MLKTTIMLTACTPACAVKKHFSVAAPLKFLALLFCVNFLAFQNGMQAQAPVLKPSSWVSNGSIETVVKEGNTIYLGGNFTSIGKNTPFAAEIDINTLNLNVAFPKPNNAVFASVPDGNGGWYIGGSFTEIDGQERKGLAHIGSDGTLLSDFENAKIGGTVYTLQLSGTTLYVGGSFPGVGASIPFATTINTSNAAVDFSFLTPNSSVRRSLPDGNGGWIIVGDFTQLGGIARNRIAHINSSNTLSNLFSATTVNSTINNICDDGSGGWIITGSFTLINGEKRGGLAHFDANGNLTTLFADIYLNSSASTIARDGTTLYIGGNFTYIGKYSGYGIPVNSSGVPNFNFATPNSTVYGSISDGLGGWIIVGNFTEVGGVSRNRIAHLDASGQLTARFAGFSFNGTVSSITNDGTGGFFIAGNFTRVNNQSRNRIAQINAADQLTSMFENTGLTGSVNEIKRSGTTLYAGGSFTYAGPDNAYGTEFTAASAVPLPNKVRPNSWVTMSVPDGNGGWIISGNFSSLTEADGTVVPRSGIAQINADGTVANAFIGITFNLTNSVRAITSDGNGGWIVGGTFTAVNNQNRGGIAHFDANGTLTGRFADRFETGGQVNTIIKDGNLLYAGGNFNYFGKIQNNGTAVSTDTGTPDFTYAQPNGAIIAAVPDGAGGWYIGGSFTQLGGLSRNYIARINSDGTVHDWNPNAGNTVNTIAVAGSTVYAGGNFTSIGGQSRNRIAAIDATTGLVTAWNPNANGAVNTIIVAGSTVYAGGIFTSIGGQTRNRIAALDATTGSASSWNPNANGTVNTIAVAGSIVYTGGSFTNIGGQTRNRIAALDATTGLATTWDPNASSTVNTIAVAGSIVYTG